MATLAIVRSVRDVPYALLLKRSFSEIPTRFLTLFREFEQRPHTPHGRQLDLNSRNGVRKYSRVTSTLACLANISPHMVHLSMS
jgi:hypothetical protein